MAEEIVIRVENLTKDYGKNRGIFDINLDVKRGETVGFIGTNGSGKTTTIRNMMGFVRPDSGTVSILNKDAWKDATDIKNYVSYIPGEIAFPAYPTGTAFLKAQADMLGVKDFSYMNRLLQLLQLDPTANLKRMSKGMKQKTAIVAALMGDKEILILDEPTTGLDPLMRDVFLDLMREEKQKGRTIFMSSQIIEEMEEVCDKVIVINDGHIIGVIDAREYRHGKEKCFLVEMETVEDAQALCQQWQGAVIVGECDRSSNTAVAHGDNGKYGKDVGLTRNNDKVCKVMVAKQDIGKLLSLLKQFHIIALHEQHDTLEDAFRALYQSQNKQNE